MGPFCFGDEIEGFESCVGIPDVPLTEKTENLVKRLVSLFIFVLQRKLLT